MTQGWKDRKNILCIRLDNMGDVIMSSPAYRALKESFGCTITLLTSSMAAGIAKHIPEVDELIVSDVPWVKGESNEGSAGYLKLVDTLRNYSFDAAVIFTVFSQNPMPSIMLAYLAGIPYRLAYCRENPYHLLTHWVPEQEPYTLVRHQVTRDLDLVASVGATTRNERLSLTVPNAAYSGMMEKIRENKIDNNVPWIIVHTCASEVKRQYPQTLMIKLLQQIIKETDLRLILTGTAKEKPQVDALQKILGERAVAVAGRFSIEEFMALVDIAPLLLSVNTGPVHIAAALNTPVIVLYALTNPQHIPWMVDHRVFTFPVEEHLKSRNEVLRYVDAHILEKKSGLPDHSEIIKTIRLLLRTARLPAS